MSDDDREKWNSRYAAGAYADRHHPSEWLVHALQTYPPARGRALDVACGAGRNALYLAAAGFQVDAVDIASVALERGRAAAAEQDLEIHWLERDLDAETEFSGSYQLIVMIRYVKAPLLARLLQRLVPGGLLVVEQHLRTDADVIGPRSPAFRVAAGELPDAADGLEVLEIEEGVQRDPDGRRVALARLIARCSRTEQAPKGG